MANPTNMRNEHDAEIKRLEAEVRIAELTAQKSEARLRAMEAEEKVREIQARRAKSRASGK
jgi:hypothetical protein